MPTHRYLALLALVTLAAGGTVALASTFGGFTGAASASALILAGLAARALLDWRR